MTIFYSCIARGSTILCSHQIGAGNYEQAAESVLTNLPTRNDGKTTITAASCKYHCMVENGIIFVCAADSDFPARSCFGYLTEIKDQFHNENFASRAVMARDHEFDSEFKNVLMKQMEKFSKPGENDNLTALQSQVHEVKGVMAQNIEKVIQRGERLDDLVDKTDELNAASATFQKTASRIRKKYWWKNTKMKLIIAIVVFLIIVGIVLAIVFGSGVLDKKDDNTTPAPGTTKSSA